MGAPPVHVLCVTARACSAAASVCAKSNQLPSPGSTMIPATNRRVVSPKIIRKPLLNVRQAILVNLLLLAWKAHTLAALFSGAPRSNLGYNRRTPSPAAIDTNGHERVLPDICPERRISTSSQPHPKQRLDSWKEIASFFERDERTVRRWEIERGLPIHRVPGAGRGGVYAFTTELEEWLRRPQSQPEATGVDAAPTDPQPPADSDSIADQVLNDDASLQWE